MKAVSVAVLCSACACSATTSSGWEFQTAAAPSAPLARYRTFSFGLPEAPAAGYQLSSSLLEAEPSVRTSIADALERKGYTEDKAHPDLVVRFGLGILRESRVDPEMTHAEHYNLEKIGVDLYDASEKMELWQGTVTLNVGRAGLDADVLQRAVHAVLASLPERKIAVVRQSAAPLAALSASVPATTTP